MNQEQQEEPSETTVQTVTLPFNTVTKKKEGFKKHSARTV